MHQLKTKKIKNLKYDEKKRFAFWTCGSPEGLKFFFYLFIYFPHHSHIDVRGLDKLRGRCRSGAPLRVGKILSYKKEKIFDGAFSSIPCFQHIFLNIFRRMRLTYENYS